MVALGRAAFRVAQAMVGIAVIAGGLATIVVVRTGASLAAGAPNPATMTPAQLKAAAAGHLELAAGPLGSGYAFDIVQTTSMRAKPGGPRIPIPDPNDGRRITGQAETYPYYTLLERGIVRSGGFWSEIRSWPVDGGEPDFDAAELRRSALVRGGVTWRNDRQGWYEADVLPGIGLDPKTAKLLPRLLRQSVGAVKRQDLVVGASTLLRVDASGDKADFPGVVAADGKAYTELMGPIEFGFDSEGRLVRIHAVARNTNLTAYDLVVDTVISIRYDWVGDLPQPEPRWSAVGVGSAR